MKTAVGQICPTVFLHTCLDKINFYTYISMQLHAMKKLSAYFIFIFFLQSAFAQNPSQPFTEKMKAEMREKVKEAVSHAWKGYKEYAWGADDLKPLTKEPKIWYSQSMLMTPVDAFDTFILLGRIHLK